MTGKPGVLQFMGSQRVRHDLATEQKLSLLTIKQLAVYVLSHVRLCSPMNCVHAQLLQLCLIPCDLMGCSPPGSSVHGIVQARILE